MHFKQVSGLMGVGVQNPQTLPLDPPSAIVSRNMKFVILDRDSQVSEV